jgi:hypothetical protein
MDSPTPTDPVATVALPRKPNGFAMFCWCSTVLAALFAGGYGYEMLDRATTAPQQAAIAGITCAIAIVPYVFSRSVEEMTRVSW